MNGEDRVAYRQQVSFCGKPQCRKCRDGIGHGPYWYAYRTEQGRTTRTYIGKHLPAGVEGKDIQTAQADASRSSRPPLGRSHVKPLVGRETEQETLRQLLFAPRDSAQARLGGAGQKKAAVIPLDTQRRPQCVVLMGEAGIGKTRLAEELSREAQDRGWAVTWSRSYAQESSIPYRLWIEVLRSVTRSDLWHKQEPARHPLVYARLAALLPELYDELPAGVSSPLQSPGQEQQSLWEAVLAFLTTAAEHAPLLIVLDDIQWADASSCDLLAYLARRSSGLPLLIVGTCREAELHPRHALRPLVAHMQREHTATTLALQPLNDAQIRTLVAGSHLPRPILQYILTQAGGNPFFAEELAYAYGIASPSMDGNKQQAILQKLSALPRSIAAALDQRMSKLSSDCQQLLSHAAILGGSFEFSLIRSMESSGGAPVDEDSVLDLLDEALQAGVLAEEGRGAAVSYHFWQPLLVSHLYNGLSATKRALLHRRAADILRQVYASREAEGAAAIIHHLIEGGGESSQIARYAELAGSHAYALSAYPEAERYYRQAIEHRGMAFSGEQKAQNQHDRLHLAYLLEQLGECLRFQGDYEEARRIFEQALAERGSLQETASRAEAEREAQVDALLESEIGWTWYYAGDYARARQHCQREEAVLRQAGVEAGPAWARLYFQQSYILWQEGSYEEARQAAYQALKLFEEHLLQQRQQKSSAAHLTRLRRTLEGDPVDLARTHRLLGALANSVGQSSEALTHLNIALAILEQHDHQREVAHVCCNVGHIHLQKAEAALAQSFLRRSLQLAERIGDIPLMSIVLMNLGKLAERAGELAEAESLFRRGITLAEEVNDSIYMLMGNVNLADVLQDFGRLAEASSSIRRALAIGHTMHNVLSTGHALVALANMRIAQAQEAQAEPGNTSYRRCLQRARATLQRTLSLQGLEAETEAKAQLALAQVSLLQGDREMAQQQAISALEKARRYELTWLLAHASRLLGSILYARGEHAEADVHLRQAMQLFRQRGMRLEYARTLQNLGTILLHHSAPEDSALGLTYLHEARDIFSECEAARDQQRIERVLQEQNPSSSPHNT